MSERTNTLVNQFEQAMGQFIAVIEGLSAHQWLTYCPEEARTVAAVARHVATGCAYQIHTFRRMAAGEPVKVWTWAELDQSNAEDGERYATCDQEETITLLKQNAAEAVEFIRSLNDEQLNRSGSYLEGSPEWTVAEWIEQTLSSHPEGHLGSIVEATTANT